MDTESAAQKYRSKVVALRNAKRLKTEQHYFKVRNNILLYLITNV